MKTLLILLFPLLLSSQIEVEKYMLDVPDTTRGLLQIDIFKGYEWNSTKTVGLSVLVFSALVDGVLEGYGFDQRRSFERKFGVAQFSFFGSISHLNKDNWYAKNFGVFDFYHTADDIRTWGGRIGGAVYGAGVVIPMFQVGGIRWRHVLIDFLISAIATSGAKRVGLWWIRS